MPKTHCMSKTLIYMCWKNLRTRCNNPNNSAYINYGGRGITICKGWDSFENFYADMGNRPDGLTIERIDNDKGYSPENCKWDSRAAQSRNQRVNRRPQKNNTTGVNGVIWNKSNKKFYARIVFDGQFKHLGSFSNIYGAIEARTQEETKHRMQREKEVSHA